MRAFKTPALCLALAILSLTSSLAGDDGVVIEGRTIKVRRITPEAKAAIEATKDYETMEVSFNKECTNEDLATIERIPWVTRLILNKGITDISPLAKIQNLAELNLWTPNLVDISPLGKLTKLSVLNLHGTKVQDLKPLAGLTGLRTFSISRTSVEDPGFAFDLAPLSGLTGLERLSLASVTVKSEAPLKGLVHLEIIDLHMVKSISLSFAADMTELEYLNVYSCEKVQSLPLRNCRKLKSISLYMVKAPAKEFEALSGMPELESASLMFFAPIKDLRCVAGCAKLNRLYLRHLPELESLKGAETLTALRTLSMDNVLVKDLSPLLGLTSLQSLTLIESPTMPEAQIDKIKKALPRCKVDVR